VITYEHLYDDKIISSRLGDLEDYYYLKGTIHRDDDDMLLYKTTRVYVFKRTGDLVGDRTLILKDGSLFEDSKADPIHIRDIEILTKRYEKEKAPVARCNLLVEEKEGIPIRYDTESSRTESSRVQARLTSLENNDQFLPYCLAAEISVDEICTPLTRRQALKSQQQAEWLFAERKEIDSIIEKGVLEATVLPAGKNLLKTKWVYKLKHGPDGSLKSYKVRLVACGYAQVYGVDLDETYSPVARLTSLRIIFAIAAQLRLSVHQMGVETAFLNADVTEEIYIKPPEDFPLAANANRFRLRKALYGLSNHQGNGTIT